MDNKQILKFCIENGLLVDEEILNLFSETMDEDSAKLVLSKIKESTQQKVITKKIFLENKENVNRLFCEMPEENQKTLEKLKIKLGLSIEIEKEATTERDVESEIKKPLSEFYSPDDVKIKTVAFPPSKKIEVKDFINYFRNRFIKMRAILQDHGGLNNLVSINKISGNRQGISIIGIVYSKRVTKNKNLILELEDMTGKIKILINKNKKDLYEVAEDITLDSVIAVRGSGSRDIIFVNDVIFPEAIIFERKRAPDESFALFIGDLHIGSKLFMEKEFQKFIDYLNGRIPQTPEVDKIKYLVVSGDIVAGIGNYPGQEKQVLIPNLVEQFQKAAEFFSQIPSHIKVIVSPGNHDGVRLMEPQPTLNKKYAWPLYDIENIIFVTNPANVNIASGKGFKGMDILLYHGFSFHYYTNNIQSLVKNKANNKPEMVLSFLLKNRHLAPTHASSQYFPYEEDVHLIQEIPDIFVVSHVHKSSVGYYNNILMITTSSWESMTAYQEKLGNEPDFCKVPMVNLKTRAVKILDFE